MRCSGFICRERLNRRAITTARWLAWTLGWWAIALSHTAAAATPSGASPALSWGESIGSQPVVLPGFSPITTHGTDVSLYGRVYSWGPGYLPRHIYSLGTQLVRQFVLKLRVGGEAVDLVPDSVEISESASDHVLLVARGKVVAGLIITVRTRIEYDGVAMVNVSLTPETPVSIDGLDMDITIQDAPSMQVLAFNANSIRKQQHRDDLLKLPFRGPFINVVGFADGVRSFWWFADNAKGWTERSAQSTEVWRGQGLVHLRQHIISAPTVIEENRAIDFNFLATPVRDIGAKWRNERVVLGVPSTDQAALGAKYLLWWTTAFAHDTFPYTEYPLGTETLISKRDVSTYPGLSANRAAIRRAKSQFDIDMIPYMSAHALSVLDPVAAEMRKDWQAAPPMIFRGGVKPFETLFDKPIFSHQARGFSDHLLSRLSSEAERLQFSGVYLDHGPPVDSRNPSSGGWLDERGNLQPSLDILGTRAFIKRLRTMFQQKGLPGYVFVHASNREIIPAFTFATAIVDGEQYQSKSGLVDGDYMDLISMDELRTRFSPDQYGVLNIWLAGAWKGHPRTSAWWGSALQARAYRNQMALALLHDIPVWPVGAPKKERSRLVHQLDTFGVNKATFAGYWLQPPPAETSTPGIYISCYSRADMHAALMVVVNTNTTAQTARIAFDLKSLRLNPSDPRPLEVSVDNHSVSGAVDWYDIPVPAKDFALVIIGTPVN